MLRNQISAISYGPIKLKGYLFAYFRAKYLDHPGTASVFLMALQDEDDSQGLGWHSLGKS